MNLTEFEPETCIAVCSFQTQLSYFVIPLALAIIVIFSAPIILWKLKERPWLIIVSFLFSFLLIPIFGMQFSGGGCGSGCDKNSHTTNVKLWHLSEEPLWEDVRYGW
ncbi:MAG: hypothetical protein P8J32_07815 [bacterium]|jgi:hypothetical protein|nr:hypothetical protein [bacterium]